MIKKAAKRLFERSGLIVPAQHAYFNLKTATPSTLLWEVAFRIGGSPDGLPLPPARLIYDVIGCRWAKVFYDSGNVIVSDMLKILDDHGITLTDRSILDFGCGCGRLIRHLPTTSNLKIYGSDYNPDFIEWCSENLPFATFGTNELDPPLRYESGSFDFVYARSVFTHLDDVLQRKWVEELDRIIKPGGFLYLTMHGKLLSAGLSDAQKRSLESGGLVTLFEKYEGKNLCSAFAYPRYMEDRLLSPTFNTVAFVEGRQEKHLKQDIYLLMKPF